MQAGSDHSKSAGAADDSEGGAPLIMSNKNQRAKDDQNLKVVTIFNYLCISHARTQT